MKCIYIKKIGKIEKNKQTPSSLVVLSNSPYLFRRNIVLEKLVKLPLINRNIFLFSSVPPEIISRNVFGKVPTKF